MPPLRTPVRGFKKLKDVYSAYDVAPVYNENDGSYAGEFQDYSEYYDIAEEQFRDNGKVYATLENGLWVQVPESRWDNEYEDVVRNRRATSLRSGGYPEVGNQVQLPDGRQGKVIEVRGKDALVEVRDDAIAQIGQRVEYLVPWDHYRNPDLGGWQMDMAVQPGEQGTIIEIKDTAFGKSYVVQLDDNTYASFGNWEVTQGQVALRSHRQVTRQTVGLPAGYLVYSSLQNALDYNENDLNPATTDNYIIRPRYTKEGDQGEIVTQNHAGQDIVKLTGGETYDALASFGAEGYIVALKGTPYRFKRDGQFFDIDYKTHVKQAEATLGITSLSAITADDITALGYPYLGRAKVIRDAFDEVVIPTPEQAIYEQLSDGATWKIYHKELGGVLGDRFLVHVYYPSGNVVDEWVSREQFNAQVANGDLIYTGQTNFMQPTLSIQRNGFIPTELLPYFEEIAPQVAYPLPDAGNVSNPALLEAWQDAITLAQINSEEGSDRLYAYKAAFDWLWRQRPGYGTESREPVYNPATDGDYNTWLIINNMD